MSSILKDNLSIIVYCNLGLILVILSIITISNNNTVLA